MMMRPDHAAFLRIMVGVALIIYAYEVAIKVVRAYLCCSSTF